MRSFVTLITTISLSASIWATPVTLKSIADNNTNQLFGQLAQYENQPHNQGELKTTWKAIHALLSLMAPNIKALKNFRGIFFGNCTVFFNDKVDSANCKLESSLPNTKHTNSTFLAGNYLSAAYWNQIRHSNILLASIYGDWRRGKKEKFDTNLYFKQQTCANSLSQSESKISTETNSITPTKSETAPPPTLSFSNSKTNSESDSISWERVNLEYALWSSTTGTYSNSAEQSSRFNTQNGVVTDSYTSLQWQKSGSTSTYTWSDIAAAGSAQEYCASQTTGGFNDWRLPTRIQLQTIINYGSFSVPAIDTSVFLNTQSDKYWTGSKQSSSIMWAIDASLGNANARAPSSKYYVRCVRLDTQTKSKTSRYTTETGAELTNTSTQVKDSFTGLIWQRQFSENNSFETSKTYCNSLTLGGHSWRLATLKELSTLIDLSITSGASIDPAAFPRTPAKEFWPSTGFRNAFSSVWSINFNRGGIDPSSPSKLNSVRCVR